MLPEFTMNMVNSLRVRPKRFLVEDEKLDASLIALIVCAGLLIAAVGGAIGYCWANKVRNTTQKGHNDNPSRKCCPSVSESLSYFFAARRTQMRFKSFSEEVNLEQIIKELHFSAASSASSSRRNSIVAQPPHDSLIEPLIQTVALENDSSSVYPYK